MRERFDVIYCECSGDIVGAFENWASRRDDSSSPTVTYSSQFFEFTRSIGARVYALSGCPRPAIARGTDILVAHHRREVLPLPLVGYHLMQLRYALRLVGLALRYRPRAMYIDSGVTDWIFLAPLRLLGVRIIAVLHNSLWPNGFPPTRPGKRLLLFADRIFFRYFASAVFCVSPAISRQLTQLLDGRDLPVVEFGASFEPRHFIGDHSAPAHGTRPFRVLFAGRIERNKGVFDLLHAARQLEAELPGEFVYDICGDGSDVEALARQAAALGLDTIFRLHGRLDRDKLVARYRAAHVVVVPTRSDFCEGFAQVVAEAVLLGRPVITNVVVPALETLREAIVEFVPDDASSLATGIRLLADDGELFAAKRAACTRYREWIFDTRRGYLTQLLKYRDLLGTSAGDRVGV
jgi:glycosyltransferase involved in cell wall biosynthesis